MKAFNSPVKDERISGEDIFSRTGLAATNTVCSTLLCDSSRGWHLARTNSDWQNGSIGFFCQPAIYFYVICSSQIIVRLLEPCG